ncbi:MAG: hypothetical protein LBM39_01815 [Candidatus Methanoplasma sp.]|jgi:hypothetical protein|nr:hypothetical protein [Candidatus Methanoplasma sp.]
MDFGTTTSMLAIVIVLVTVISIVILVKVHLDSKQTLKNVSSGKNGGKPTYFLDEGEDEKKCDICYGEIGDDPVAKCACGKIFHDACARPTGACPYCGAPYVKMTVRDPVRSRCPVCGRFVKGGICACGAVLPRRDGTFLCSCGARVDGKKPVCRKCGAVYESVTMQSYKNKQ